jgi:hypothetical protein
MFVTRGSKNSLFYVFDSLSNLDCGQWYQFWIWQSHPMSAPTTQSVDSRARITSLSIQSFVEWLDTFSYVLRHAPVTVKEVNHIRCLQFTLQNILYSFPVVLLWVTCACCNWRQHLQRLSPQYYGLRHDNWWSRDYFSNQSQQIDITGGKDDNV